MKTSTNRLAQVLRALMGKPGRSQRWLCQASGMSISTLNRILAGEQEPASEHIRALREAFPDWSERRQVVVAHLQDQLEGSGEALGRVLIRDLDEVEASNIHLLPELDGYLRTISHRLMQEQSMPEAERLVTQQVDWLSDVATRLSAMESDLAAQGSVEPLAFATAPQAPHDAAKKKPRG